MYDKSLVQSILQQIDDALETIKNERRLFKVLMTSQTHRLVRKLECPQPFLKMRFSRISCAESKQTLHIGVYLAHHPPLPQERVPFKIQKGPKPLASVALRG